MTISQVQSIMNDKQITDVEYILFAPSNKLFISRYKTIELDNSNGYFKCITNNGKLEYWDYTNIIGISFKESYVNTTMKQINEKLIGSTTIS